MEQNLVGEVGSAGTGAYNKALKRAAPYAAPRGTIAPTCPICQEVSLVLLCASRTHYWHAACERCWMSWAEGQLDKCFAEKKLPRCLWPQCQVSMADKENFFAKDCVWELVAGPCFAHSTESAAWFLRAYGELLPEEQVNPAIQRLVRERPDQIAAILTETQKLLEEIGREDGLLPSEWQQLHRTVREALAKGNDDQLKVACQKLIDSPAGVFYKRDLQEVVGRLRSAFRLPPSWSVESMLRGSADKLLAKNEVTDGTLLRLFDERLGLFALSADVFGHRATRPVWNMARLSSLVVLAACALLARHVSTLLFANAPSTSSRSLRMAQQAVDERDEGLVLIKPEESGKVVKRDKFNNPPRIVMKTNDWDQPEIQLSTGASNQINYITPVVQSDDIKAWLSLNVNFFAIIGLTTVGGLIEIQRFFPDTLLLRSTALPHVRTRDRRGLPPRNFRAVKAVQIMNAPCWASYLQRRDHVLQQCLKVKAAVSAFTPLKREANECWLFHGTSHHAAEGITTDDFDMTRANPAGLFGAGVYFAESVSKADEYVKGKHVDGVELFPLLLCRVCLGYIYYCDQRRPSARELEEHCLLEDWHSVLGDRKKTSNTFREFIIYDNLQAFPAYIIYYSREY
eukprot:g12898.t1